MSRRPVGDRLVMSPMESLVAGGVAEAFERQLQQLYPCGYKHLAVDVSGVSAMDSAGIRALVRGHLTAQRVGGTLRLAAAPRPVARVFDARTSLEDLSAQLMADGAGVKSAAWEHSKRERR
jgi:anti-anti-sigma factor